MAREEEESFYANSVDCGNTESDDNRRLGTNPIESRKKEAIKEEIERGATLGAEERLGYSRCQIL